MHFQEVKFHTQPSERVFSVRKALAPLLEEMGRKKETIGVCVLGSYAMSGIRPTADKWSDFDAALFIDIPLEANILSLPPLEFQRQVQPFLPDWLPNFKFHFPFADPDDLTDAPRLQVNVHQLIYPYESQQRIVWPADRREAFANTCDLVFDRHGKVAGLIREKSQPSLAELKTRVANNLALIPVTLEHSVEKASLRTAFADAQLALAETVALLIDLAYAVNYKDTPHQKWRIKMMPTLTNLPDQFLTRLDQLLTQPMLSLKDATEKLLLIRTMFLDLASSVPNELLPDADPYRDLITNVRPGFQLRYRTAADKFLDQHGDCVDFDQYERMKNEQWNLVNFYLASGGDEK